jgi:hypothetical protein
MLSIRNSIIVVMGLCASASLYAMVGIGELRGGSEGRASLPIYLRTDAHVTALASAIELGDPGRTARDIAAIDGGCPGTGLLEATFNGPDIHLIASQLPDTVFSLFVYGPPVGQPFPFYDGFLCAHWGFLQRSAVSATSVGGVTSFDGIVQPNLGDDVVSVQCIYRTPTGTGTYGGNLTNGLLVSFEPLP